MKVFAISGMDSTGEIITSGEAGTITRHCGESYTAINGKGPYNSAFVFIDTPENRALFSDFIAKRKRIERELGSEMYQTLNAMKRCG